MSLFLLCVQYTVVDKYLKPCISLLILLSALGQIMLYVDGMNGVIGHPETIQWLYTLVGSKVTAKRLCTKRERREKKKKKDCRLSLALNSHPLFGKLYF